MDFNVGRKEESYPKFYFPEILISDSYKELVERLPEEPELPVKEVVKDERRGPLTFSTILLLILVVVVFIRPDFFKNVIGTIGLLLAYKLLRTAVESSEYESNLKKVESTNKIAFDKYYEEMQEYQPFLDFKNAILADIEEGAEVSKNSVLSNLYRLNNIIISNATGIKSGFSENKFLLYLKLTFGEKIKTEVGVSTSTGFDYYFPDFVYYDDLKQILFA